MNAKFITLAMVTSLVATAALAQRPPRGGGGGGGGGSSAPSRSSEPSRAERPSPPVRSEPSYSPPPRAERPSPPVRSEPSYSPPPRAERPSPPVRSEPSYSPPPRAERPSPPVRSEPSYSPPPRAERPSAPVRSEPTYSEPSRTERPSRIERPARVERPSAPVRSEPTYSEPSRSERPSRAERPTRVEPPTRIENPSRGEVPSRGEIPSRTERPSAPVRNPSAGTPVDERPRRVESPAELPSRASRPVRERISDPRDSVAAPVRDAGRRANNRARIDGWESTNPNAPVDQRLARRRNNLENPSAVRSVPRDRMVMRNRTDIARERVYRPPTSTVRDVRGNYVSRAHVSRVHRADDRMRNVMRADRRISRHLGGYSDIYRERYRPDLLRRYSNYNDLWRERPGRWNRWYDYGFYGGYYWNLGDYIEIQSYYSNPFIYYYFASDYSTNYWNESSYYYQTWYGNEYSSIPIYREPFPYTGVFYPTTSMRDLLLGASDMSISDQNDFHASVRRMVELLQSKLGNVFGRNFRLDRNDIIITHYRLVDGQAAVVEGTAGRNQDQYPFKAFLDLRTPSRTQVFIATSEDPNTDSNSLRELDQLNDTIDRIFSVGSENEDYVGIEYGVDPTYESENGRFR